MKIISIHFLIILGFTPSSFAQVNIDSLYRVMDSNNDYPSRIGAYLQYVNWYELKNFDSAIIAGNVAIDLARKEGDSIMVAELKRHIGIATYFKGDYPQSAGLFYESISILEKTREQKKLGYVYNDLAKLYRKTRNLDRALLYYNKSDAIFRRLRDTADIAMILNESGVVFEYKKDYEEALKRYTSSLNLAEAIGDSISVSYSLSDIAGILVIEKKYDEAEKNLLRALAIRQKMGDGFAIALNYSDLGAALNAKGDYAKAANYLQESNKVAEQLHYQELLSNNYNELSSLYEKKGDYKEALNYFRKRTELRDSLFALDKTKQIEELNSKYESVKKIEMIGQQQAKLRLQNFLFIGIAGLVLLAGLLVHSQYRRMRLRQEALMKTQLIKQQEIAMNAVLEAEENERQRIARDLHDGLGQMMSAAGMNLSAFESELKFSSEDQKKSFEKITGLIDESCRELRTVSHAMMPGTVVKKGLAEAVRDFVEKLDKKSMHARVDAVGDFAGIDLKVEIMLYRVIQESVNNVLKHATATELDISMARDSKEITITIEDNGKGFDIGGIHKSDGIGVRNIMSRVEWLKGKVEFDSSPGRGTVVTIHIPVKDGV